MLLDDVKDLYFVSDLHIGHETKSKEGKDTRGIIHFERTQFETIQEHDEAVHTMLERWASKHPDCGLFVLGDWGNVETLHWVEELRIQYPVEFYFMYGNHDSMSDLGRFQDAFTEVYCYPTYLTDRVLLSHIPQYPLPQGVINVHGHLHGQVLDDKRYMTASLNDVGWTPICYSKSIKKRLSQVPKASYKFLREPYRELYKVTRPHPDLVTTGSGRIRLKESIALYNEHHGTHFQ